MKNTVIVCSTNRHVQDNTMRGLETLQRAGGQLIWGLGSPDVAFARNIALTAALRYSVTRNKQAAAPDPGSVAIQRGDAAPRPNAVDTILMVDDDMEFTLDQANELVAYSREHQVGAAAMYATLGGTLAATRLYTPLNTTQRWLVGLGFLALPLKQVQEVAARSEHFEALGQVHVEFCWTAAYDGIWCAEDYSLCRRFGGVHLLPMAVGHLKTVPCYPDEETIRRVRENQRLPGELEDGARVMRHVDDPTMLAALRAKP